MKVDNKEVKRNCFIVFTNPDSRTKDVMIYSISDITIDQPETDTEAIFGDFKPQKPTKFRGQILTEDFLIESIRRIGKRKLVSLPGGDRFFAESDTEFDESEPKYKERISKWLLKKFLGEKK